MAATKWGIISAGLISFDFVNALTTVKAEDHQVVAIAARNKERADKFAKDFDIPKAYGSYEELANDSDVEVVYIGSINPAHLEICKLMLNKGKHVLCEKPMGMNVKETREMVALAREKKLFLMEAMWARCQPAYRKLKEELDKGTIGEVLFSQVEFGLKIDAERVLKKELGGGTMLDLGVYTVFFSQLVFGGERPSKIVASGHLNDDGVDESVSAVLTYKNGRTATLSTHSRVALSGEAIVYGTKGSMKLGYPFWASQTLTTPTETFRFDLPSAKYDSWKFWNSAGLVHEANHVRECLQQGFLESPWVTLDETLLVAEIMEDIRKQVGVTYPQD